ncbi:Serine/threonine protein kinase OSK1 like [Verticillium longisporum]|nr:Serine/threonine protein kinase OSK1 like [Verticillium longisporum]KAG7148011.1 Serine/threonine protein kinase OSK1 like [Verticillium longisporum]
MTSIVSFRPWPASLWAFISRRFGRNTPSYNTEQLKSSRRAAPAIAEDTSDTPHRLVIVSASFQHDATPNQPDKDHTREVYYTRKGKFVGCGSNVIVEQLDSGHIIKSPLPNPFKPNQEERNRRKMEREVAIYEHLGSCPHIPRLISWDPIPATLTLECLANQDLHQYVQSGVEVPFSIRTRWASQAATALAALHSAGVTHNDVAPRNFLLDGSLNLRICDFASSSLPNGSAPEDAPGPRYQSHRWAPGYLPTQADDIFALGSVIYFIMTGLEPLSELEDEEVEYQFATGHFPDTQILHGELIQTCWRDRTTTATRVVDLLNEGNGCEEAYYH